MSVEDTTAPGPHGPVPVRVYRSSARPRRVFVWNHGGAFAHGDLDMPEAHWVSSRIAQDTDTIVVSVDYRRASDTVHYPVPSDDVVAAFRWAVELAERTGVDRVHLGGGSAGGNLAAGAAIRLRDAGGPQPATVLLAYPTLHAVQPPHEPALERVMAGIGPEYRFSPQQILDMYETYTGGPASEAPVEAIPPLARLEELPPTYIVNSDEDDLRTSGEHYARLLAEAGVEVVVETEPASRHGHLNRPDTPDALGTIRRMESWLLARDREPAGTA